MVNALRQARRARGWTRAQLAERAGVHLRTIDGWEYKGQVPNVEQAGRVAAALGLRLAVVVAEPLPEGRAHVRVEPSMNFGAPYVGDHGVTCEAVAGHVAVEGVEAVMGDYTLRRQDVLVACWHVGLYGGARWRFWRDWAHEAGWEMWHATTVDYARIPDPPDRPERPATAP